MGDPLARLAFYTYTPQDPELQAYRTQGFDVEELDNLINDEIKDAVAESKKLVFYKFVAPPKEHVDIKQMLQRREAVLAARTKKALSELAHKPATSS